MKRAYDGGAAFDEAFERDGEARAHYRGIVTVLESFTQGEVSRRERLQKLALVDQGITFTVYGKKEGLERIFPFDFVPRIVTANKGIYRGPARETLTAEIYTRTVASTAISRAGDDLRTIELRTFATAPARRGAPTTLPPATEEQAEQQQQQQ